MTATQIIVRIKKRHLCFLKSISNKCRKNEGKALCRNSIMRALISVAKNMNIDVRGLKNEEELRKKIMEAFGNWE